MVVGGGEGGGGVDHWSVKTRTVYFFFYVYPVVWLTVGAPLQILQPASSTPRGSRLFVE